MFHRTNKAIKARDSREATKAIIRFLAAFPLCSIRGTKKRKREGLLYFPRFLMKYIAPTATTITTMATAT